MLTLLSLAPECKPSTPRPPRPQDRLLTVKKVAGLLGVSRRTVFRLLENGTLHRIKVGCSTRIHPDDLACFAVS